MKIDIEIVFNIMNNIVLFLTTQMLWVSKMVAPKFIFCHYSNKKKKKKKKKKKGYYLVGYKSAIPNQVSFYS